MTTGERIRMRRIDLGLSQEELAAKLGYAHKSSINKIELGLRNLTQSKIMAIAEALDTTPSYIMGWDDEEPEIDPEEVKMKEYYGLISQLDERGQEDVLNYINFLLSKKK